jgi:hypothetical protein
MAARSSRPAKGTTAEKGRVDPANADLAVSKRRRRKKRGHIDPPPELVEWGKQAEKRVKARSIPAMVMMEPAGFDQEHMVALHGNERLHELQLTEAFGTRSRSVIYTFMEQLEALCSAKWWDEEAQQWRLDEHAYNTALALVASVKPKSEMEAALAAQMAAVHILTMKVTARAIRYDYDTRTAAVAGKLARTFAMQMDAMRAMKGKSRTAKQSIKVTKETHQHVHYHQHRGEGECDGRLHGTTDAGEPEECTSLQGNQSRGQVLRLPSRPRSRRV